MPSLQKRWRKVSGSPGGGTGVSRVRVVTWPASTPPGRNVGPVSRNVQILSTGSGTRWAWHCPHSAALSRLPDAQRIDDAARARAPPRAQLGAVARHGRRVERDVPARRAVARLARDADVGDVRVEALVAASPTGFSPGAMPVLWQKTQFAFQTAWCLDHSSSSASRKAPLRCIQRPSAMCHSSGSRAVNRPARPVDAFEVLLVAPRADAQRDLRLARTVAADRRQAEEEARRRARTASPSPRTA